MEFIEGQKGSRKLFFNKFLFRRDGGYKDSEYWRCDENKNAKPGSLCVVGRT
jgi:hypothetical protein